MRYIHVMQISMQYGSLHRHFIGPDDDVPGDDDDYDDDDVDDDDQGDEIHLSQWSAHHLSQVPTKNLKRKRCQNTI